MDDIKETTKNLDKSFKEIFSTHPDKRKIIEGSLEEEKEMLKRLTIENREVLNNVVT